MKLIMRISFNKRTPEAETEGQRPRAPSPKVRNTPGGVTRSAWDEERKSRLELVGVRVAAMKASTRNAPVGESRGDDAKEDDLRCLCGSLLARRVPTGIELKCRRCRRCVLLIWHADGEIAVVDSEAVGNDE
jgi:hypothetical protein